MRTFNKPLHRLLPLLLAFSATTKNAYAADVMCSGKDQKTSLCVGGFDLDADNVQFVMSFPKSFGWASVGLGSSMADADVMIVWVNADGSVTLSDRLSKGYIPPTPDRSQDLVLVAKDTDTKSDPVRIVFNRKKNTGDPDDKQITVGQKLDYIWAYGSKNPGSNAPDAKIEPHADNTKSTGKADLFGKPGDGQNLVGAGPLEGERLAHGLLMFFAWGVFCPLAIYIARYFKNELDKWWFRLHWFINSIGVIGVQSAAFWVIYSVKQNGQSSPHVISGFHAIFGLIILSLGYLQFLLGIFIHVFYNADRTVVPITDRIHHWIGRVLGLFVFIEITYGIAVYNGGTAWLVIWILYALAVVVTFYFTEKRFRTEGAPKSANESGNRLRPTYSQEFHIN